ncbi:MAG: prolyl oligopeptidase family serine peptidase, partial [Acidobacteriota bacterium]
GRSGGGFTTAYHLTHTALFKLGIAGAPPTDWRLYDSIYTERYMGLPSTHQDAYDRTSAILAAENLTGRLLLLHGTHDDNVHPQNSIKLIDALIRAGKQFDIMLYPNKAHGITGTEHRLHLYRRVLEHLEQHL